MKYVRFAVLFILTMPTLVFSGMKEIKELAVSLSAEYKDRNPQILFRKNLAVLKLENITPLMTKHNVGAVVSAMLTTEMSESTIFRLVEREKLGAIVDEVKMGLAGLVNPETAVKAGEMSGADLLLLGGVNETDNGIVINVRLVSTEKGEVVAAKTITVSTEKLIRQAEDLNWNAFQSQYGLSLGYETSGAFIYNNYFQVHGVSASYRIFKHLRVGVGYFVGGMNGYDMEKFAVNWFNGDSVNIQRSYGIIAQGGKLFLDLILPVQPWLNTALRVEGMILVPQIEQAVHGFPIADPNSSNPTNDHPIEKRILVYAWDYDALFAINPMFVTEVLISKRVSLHVGVGYMISGRFTPEIYRSGDDERHTGNIDQSGTFPQYGTFNFSRTRDGRRVEFSISGISINMGLSMHF